MRSPLKALALFVLPRVPPGRMLARRELRTLERVAETLLDGAPTGVTSSQVASNVEEFLVRGRSRRAWRVRVLLTVIELAPLAAYRRTFSAMTLEDRAALVRTKWTTGRHVWRICAKVRNLVILGAYGDRAAAASTGYVPVTSRPRFRSVVTLQHPREVA